MPKSRAAYGHKRKPKVEIDGIKFMSPGEAEYYLELCIKRTKREIGSFSLQPKFVLQEKFRKNGVLYREITYSADFRVDHNDGKTEIIDIKGSGGYTTPEFRLKRKLWEHKFPQWNLTILKRTGSQKNRDRLMAERAALK